MKKLVFLSFCLLLLSCKKQDNGTGGNGTSVSGTISFQIQVMHHQYAVPGISVFLKKGTLDFPGTDTTIYDRSAKADNGGVVLFDKLFPGNYFLYAKGYDPNWGANVVGGSPATLNSSSVTNNEAYITLNVTE